jgi:hypothetical protein
MPNADGGHYTGGRTILPPCADAASSVGYTGIPSGPASHIRLSPAGGFIGGFLPVMP